MPKDLKPRAVEAIGEDVTVFGIRARVCDVVPQDDWHWLVSLSSINGAGAEEDWSIVLPTDYRTTDNQTAWAGIGVDASVHSPQITEQMYLVCRQCGEAFDSIDTATSHLPIGCGSDQGWDILPESEAM